jgi:hypothetical protein
MIKERYIVVGEAEETGHLADNDTDGIKLTLRNTIKHK